MLDSLKRDGGVQQARSAEDSTELNLFGDREFLTAETATEALGPMLAPGSAITKVACSDAQLWSAAIDRHGRHACPCLFRTLFDFNMRLQRASMLILFSTHIAQRG